MPDRYPMIRSNKDYVKKNEKLNDDFPQCKDKVLAGRKTNRILSERMFFEKNIGQCILSKRERRQNVLRQKKQKDARFRTSAGI
jgi:hypothetical protein